MPGGRISGSVSGKIAKVSKVIGLAINSQTRVKKIAHLLLASQQNVCGLAISGPRKS
jgi:hypothetical protein